VPDRFTSIIDVHVVLRRAGQILLLRRAGDVYASGQLCLPSGHLEDGENILEAAVRETKEETGVTLDPATMRLTLSIHQRHPGTTHTRIGFVFDPGPLARRACHRRACQMLPAPTGRPCQLATQRS
jgi:8-oxo-dGTP diphosphatase